MPTGAESMLIQYGALGILALVSIIAVRILFNRLSDAYNRERDRADRLEAELKSLNDVIRSDYLGTIAKASDAIGEANRVVSEVLLSIRRN
jgi:hypothetical protein